MKHDPTKENDVAEIIDSPFPENEGLRARVLSVDGEFRQIEIINGGALMVSLPDGVTAVTTATIADNQLRPIRPYPDAQDETGNLVGVL